MDEAGRVCISDPDTFALQCALDSRHSYFRAPNEPEGHARCYTFTADFTEQLAAFWVDGGEPK